jgi:hypothetical protein
MYSTSIWALFYQTVGGAIVIPLWYIFFILKTSQGGYWTFGNDISRSTAKALLPALLVGYLAPTIAVFLPALDIKTRQYLVAFWQPTPLFVNIVWWLCSFVYSKSYENTVDTAGPQTESSLKLTYAVATAVSAIAHLAVLATCLTTDNTQLSLYNVFWPVSRTHWEMSEALHFIFKVDYLIIHAASLLSCYLSIFDLTYLNMTSVGVVRPAIFVTIAAVILGPGAALSGTWYWRESIMRRKQSEAKAK